MLLSVILALPPHGTVAFIAQHDYPCSWDLLVPWVDRRVTREAGDFAQQADAIEAGAELTLMNGWARCRMHGGAKGSGAPKSERNGNYRHGLFTIKAVAKRRRIAALMRQCRELLLRCRDAAPDRWVAD